MFNHESRFSSFRNGPLSDDQIRHIAPSVFAADKHESRSDRYTYIPTIDVINGLRKEGFDVYKAAQGRSRVPGKSDFTKHMLRLRHRDTSITGVGCEYNEIVLINSHDGTSSYNMQSGVYRVACMNGMIVCTNQLNDIKVPHKGQIVDQVVQAAYDTIDGFGLVRDITENMKALRLSAPEATLFADAALSIKYDDEDQPAPIRAEQLLRPNRREDTNPDLWTTFNVIQENVIRGGVRGRSANGRRISTREVTGIDSNVKLNRALWMLAEKMAELKNAG